MGYPMTNPYGDVELDAAGMRALAHPVRIQILFRLQSEPATATMLSKTVGASPSVTSWHLRHLAQFGLVVDAPELGRGRERWWRAAGTGFRYEVTDEASRLAAISLQSALDQVRGDVVGDWRREVEPLLDADWRAEASSHDTTVTVTLSELREINRAVEALLAPYVTREERPPDARPVQMVRHVMPSADSDSARDGHDRPAPT
ncbi:ArsR/SmtB family transcription factor [Microlunatus soli]|uniref:DNA-binding transcriptional regulator, ArsR family n=1 Tax=Microlunatus soli TaxID=630515 RepID=A0A1H1TCA2_9ACTN|nr:helix-turn-helix domain-containing protein [Microlunatus soli]SDS57833.1 DNA-binding transcriptional regulator, ArsR family [Microlunatus soli]